MIRLLCLLGIWTSCASAAQASISIYQDVYDDYLCFLNGQSVLSIEQYDRPCKRKDVVEAVLVQQILHAGGFHHDIQLQPHQALSRNKQQLIKGDIVLAMETFWQFEALALRKQVYISPPLIKRNQYEAGLFTAPSNQRALSVTSPEALSGMTMISHKNWDADWQTLTALKPAKLVDQVDWLKQFDAVASGQVDIMLGQFNDHPELHIVEGSRKIVPIPGIKVNLKQSRHVLISKQHPLGKQALQAFSRGIKLFRSDKRIIRAYRQVGFYNPKVANWKTINS